MTRALADRAPCRILDWDSAFFGRRIARLESGSLDPAILASVRDFARREAIDCVYCLLDAADVEGRRTAETEGLLEVDVRVTLERASEAVDEPPSGIDAFDPADLPALRALARRSHGASRFYHDPRFPRERCDALYDAWITRACTEHPDGVLVARRDARAVGYLACDLESPETGSIGLVAVADGERGLGLGSKLVTASLDWVARRGRPRVRVVTQGRNRAAARLYERMGFAPTRVEHWYHLWPDEGARS